MSTRTTGINNYRSKRQKAERAAMVFAAFIANANAEKDRQMDVVKTMNRLLTRVRDSLRGSTSLISGRGTLLASDPHEQYSRRLRPRNAAGA